MEGKEKGRKSGWSQFPDPAHPGFACRFPTRHSPPYTSVSGKMAHLVTPNTVCVQIGWLFLKCLPISYLDSPYFLRWDRYGTDSPPPLSLPEPLCTVNKLSSLCMFFCIYVYSVKTLRASMFLYSISISKRASPGTEHRPVSSVLVVTFVLQ